MKEFRNAYTFDDVALVPQYNNVESRTEPSTKTWVTKNFYIDIPLLAANMDTVICPELANVLIENGTIPIFHRFDDQENLYKLAENYRCFMSVGLNTDIEVIQRYGMYEKCLGVCIDIAHGHDKRMLNLISEIKTKTTLDVIAGNVCTAGGYIDLVQAGADAVKVGIGPGAACTTRTVTGFGVPQFTAIMECAEQAKKYSVPIIADGGIRGSADIVKALAAGACSVMMGKIFALTEESAAEIREVYDGTYPIGLEKKYRGQASKDFQDDFKGGLKKGTVAEGEAFWAPITGSTQSVIDELMGGVRSGMTYGGARSIGELQRKAEFVVVQGGYQAESNTRK